nr:unnamed protein product [Spirometra erinaceieuropaei]
MSSTFDDFWQMIWDENCSIIVMISNFVERGKRKCDQYWPSEGQQSYGTISVRMLSETVLACYVIRVFDVKNLKCKKFAKDRIVYHYQYTDWRDFDVPLSPLPVLVFVKTTVAHWSSVTGPITVHCSAGVGRTGTYICIESLIRQLETENQVNIQGFLEHIRQQRMKLVQTEFVAQIFCHLLIRSFGGNRAGIFCAVNFLINQFTLAGVIDVYFIVKMLHLQRAKTFRSYEDLDYIYMVIEQFLADLQQDETTEAYAAGYANLGVGIFNGTSPSVNPFVLNKSVHTNRSANSSERALQCSGGGGGVGSSAGDFVSTPPPATDRDNLLTAGDCHPDLAALQKLPDSQSATAVFTTPTPQTPSDHHNGNRTGGPTVPITSASTPATPCPQDDDDHVFELRSLAPSCSLSHSLATTEYAKTNGTVAFLNDHRIPSYHPSGHINCKSGGSVRKNAAYLATLLPPPPNQSPPPPPSLSWASDVSSPPSPHSNVVPEGVMQPDSGDLTPTTSIVCAGSHLDDGELTMTI